MNNQKIVKTRFQRFCDKSTKHLISLYVIWTVLMLIDAFAFSTVEVIDDHLSWRYYGEEIIWMLLLLLHFLVPAFSVFYLVLSFWRENGISEKLFKAAVLPACLIDMTIVLFGAHTILETQKDKLDREESIGDITYSIPNHWELVDDFDYEKEYLDKMTAAWIDVDIIEAESLEAAVNQERVNLLQEGYAEYRDVQDIVLDAPYSCFIYKTDKPQEADYSEFLIMQYGGKLYEFSIDVDEEDLSMFHKMCESIQLE